MNIGKLIYLKEHISENELDEMLSVKMEPWHMMHKNTLRSELKAGIIKLIEEKDHEA